MSTHRRMSPFSHVGGVKPRRSKFNLSYSKTFNCDMGQLIPVLCDEVIPGDHWSLGNEMVIRMQPMVAPTLHEINVYTHAFFVPYRLLDSNWEKFITRGKDGNYVGDLPLLYDLPELHDNPGNLNSPAFFPEKGTLCDFLGFPVSSGTDRIPLTRDNSPMLYPIQAMNKVYYDFYADQDLIDFDPSDPDSWDLNQIRIPNRAWTKDYFTSSRPFQQRGDSPALPITSIITGSGDSPSSIVSNGRFDFDTLPNVDSGFVTSRIVDGSVNYNFVQSAPALEYRTGLAADTDSIANSLNTVSTSFNMSDLRHVAQIQVWQERNARGGVRYTEFLRMHFGVSPRDDRLDRSEYIGGSFAPVIISEVLQTSSSDNTSPQGNLAGHGITVERGRIGKYSVQEYGVIIVFMSIMPKPSYSSQGVPRQWHRRTTFDFPFIEFQHLSEQGILNNEIYTQGTEDDLKIFGFQSMYDELRVKQNMVCNDMRDLFDYWHLSRTFEELPLLNQSFIDCVPSKRIFAVQDEPGFIVHYGNLISAVRPLSITGQPGWTDHPNL